MKRWCVSLAIVISTIVDGASDRSSWLDQELSTIEKRTGAKIGVALIDSAGGARVAYRGDERFLLCSTFKVLAAAAVLKKADAGQEKLDRVVAYRAADLLEYAPVTRAHVAEGGMKLGDLCAAAVEQSDNTAANLLLDAIGGAAGLTQFARSLGDDATNLTHHEPQLNEAKPGGLEDNTTPLAMGKNLERLLTSDDLTKTSRAQLETWMRNCATSSGMIRAAAPNDWLVGDKSGRSHDGATNDLAVMRSPSGYVLFLSIYTFAPKLTPDERATLVADVARIALEAQRH